VFVLYVGGFVSVSLLMGWLFLSLFVDMVT
jgi:hypothetical protein